ncbi:MAG: UDP-N-acetylglucosamine 2-epimerase (non-hydrolyzing) [Elusimicrobia bacterium]|nr:UDP-N-acetylglucosamine 2-epimerase (non-hydrolyzing) [Elusimicrobiota bacterium]
MNTRKILCVFGTRPEAIKMAPVVKKLQISNSKFQIRVCVTAQHRYLLDDVLKTFAIKPDYDLNIMTENQTLFYITTKVIGRMEAVLEKEKPDLVLVHGDTTTTLAAALAAFYKKIAIGHVEAGLRTHSKFNPYPEEINRLMTDSICDMHFCPTSTAKKALLSENINPKNIFITGNTVIDALHMILKKKHKFQNKILRKMFNSEFVRRGGRNSKLILITAHRRENFGKPIRNICKAIKRIAAKYPDFKIVYPVHPNPNIKIPVKKILGKTRNVFLTSPLNYPDFSNLMKNAYFILTDSGGLQEEAPALCRPVLVMRCATERPEAVAAGTVKIIGVNESRIYNEVSKLINNNKYYKKMAVRGRLNPYGDGLASDRTVGFIEYYFGLKNRKPGEFYVRTKKI